MVKNPVNANKEAELLAAVGELLDREANPAIASHGGKVTIERVENSDVYLRMSGGCQGCAASAMTLRNGIETMLRAAFPEIGQIIDLTDHNAGTNPFYAGATGFDAHTSPTFSRPLPAGAVGWEGGQIIIDPDYLAPRLGLTADSLREGLQSGDIVSNSETGKQADAGKTRVTVRTPQRAWAAEILDDGSAREVPPPREAQGPLHDQVRRYLVALPHDQLPISYGTLARALSHWAPGSIAKITKALEVTMQEDAAAGLPFIAARAVSRGQEKLPGKGFFDLARALGKWPEEGENDRSFHNRLLNEITLLLEISREPAAE